MTRIHHRLLAAAAAASSALVSGCGDERETARADSARALLTAVCGKPADAVISPRGVGRVRLGAALSDVAAVCPLTDTGTAETRRDPAERVVPLRIENNLLLLRVVRDTVIGISTADPVFRTDRGIGVGSQMRTVRFAYGPLCAYSSSDGITVQVERLDGIAFEVGSLPKPLEPGAVVPLLPDTLADQSRVTRVRIGTIPTRCGSRR